MLHMGIKGEQELQLPEVEWESLPRPQATCETCALHSPLGLTECGRWQGSHLGRQERKGPCPADPASVAIVTGEHVAAPSPGSCRLIVSSYFRASSVLQLTHGWQQWCTDFWGFLWFCSYLLSQKIFTLPALIGSLTLSLPSARHTENVQKPMGFPRPCALLLHGVINVVQLITNVSCICS